MKNNILKLYITVFYLCSTFVMFAQPGTGSDNNGIDDAGESDVTGAAPIDDYVWVLAAVGMLLVFLKFRAMYKQSATNQG
jgi:hypothetical protein